MMRKGFYISQGKITGEGKKDAVVEFTDGVNVILGPSNSGKSLILECIDYCFGYVHHNAKQTDYAEKIKALDGYNAVHVTVKTSEGSFEIVRAIDNDNHVLINGATYYISTKSKSQPKLNDFLLGLLGIREPHLIRAKKKASAPPNSVSFRGLLTNFYVRQGHIATERSIFYNPDDPSATITGPALFLFLLNGNNCDGFKKTEDPKISKARNEGEKLYIERRLSSLGPRMDQLTSLRNKMALSVSFDENLDAQVEEIQKQIDTAIKESHSIMAQIYEKNSKLSEANTIEEQFRSLQTQYESDIRRMSLILESETKIKNYPGKNICPVCGQPLQQGQHHPEYAPAIVAESKLKKEKMADLQTAQADLMQRRDKIKEEISDLESKHHIIEIRLNQELIPKIQNLKSKIELRRKYDQIVTELNVVSGQVDLLHEDLDKNQAMEKPKDEIYQIENDFNKNIIGAFGKYLRDILEQVHFPNASSAFWDMSSFDVAFGKKSKTGILGGGFCSIVNACVLIAYEQWLIDSGKYVPGCVFIDSPLTSLSESQYEAEKETIQHNFTEYLLNGKINGQVILADHTDRLKISGNTRVNVIEYTHNREHGIYGFVPDMYQDEIK